MSESDDYKYFAFISYRRVERDTKAAEQLKEYLESYKLPGDLADAFPESTGTMGPIYMGDERNDAEAADALVHSRFLVVVCTLTAAVATTDGTNHIEEAIKTFLAAFPEDGTKRVVPYIVRYPRDVATNCFPPTLKTLDRIGVDECALAAQGGRKHAFSNIAAGMLELDPDDLWQTRVRRARRNKLMLMGTGVLALLSCVGWYCWDYYFPHEYDYTDYVEVDNVPQGIGAKLSRDITENRESFYRFFWHKHTLLRVLHCNGAGTPMPMATYAERSRPVDILLRGKTLSGDDFDGYDEDGRIIRRVHRDETGRETEQWVYRHLPPDKGGREVSVVTVLRPDYPEPGKMSAARPTPPGVFNPLLPVPGDSNICGYRLILQPGTHWLSKRFFLGVNGHPVLDKDGIGGVEFTYLGEGRVSSWTFQDTYSGNDAQPAKNSTNGIASYNITYDEQNLHDPISHRFQAATGKRILNARNGVGELRMTRDKFGNPIKISCVDEDGHPVRHADGDTLMVSRYVNGNPVEVTFRDECDAKPDRPILVKDGYATIANEYDQHGRLTRRTYLGLDNKPCLHKRGYATLVRRYDPSTGDQTEEIYLDAEGRRCLTKEGYASVTKTYDAKHRLTRLRFYGTQENVPCTTKGGYSQIKMEYDRAGNRLSETFLNEEGRYCLTKAGFAAIRRTFTPPNLAKDAETRQHLESMTFETPGPNNTLQAKPSGFARVHYTYDSTGNMTEEAYTDAQGRPCPGPDGYAAIACTYSEDGKLTSVTYLDNDHRPCPRHGDTYASVNWSYRAVDHNDPSAKPDNRALEVRFSAGDPGTLVKNRAGYAVLRRTYSQGAPTQPAEGSDADQGDNSDEEARSVQKLDEVYLDESEHPCPTREGYAHKQVEFFSDGRVICESYYADEKFDTLCINTSLGCARITRTFSPRGALETETYRGTDGKPCLCKNGYATIKWEYDKTGKITVVRTYDLSGKVISQKRP